MLTQHLPKLFCDMRRERSDEDYEGLQQLFVLALLLRKLIHADHEGRDGGVV